MYTYIYKDIYVNIYIGFGNRTFYFFFMTLDVGPRMSLIFEWTGTKDYAPSLRESHPVPWNSGEQGMAGVLDILPVESWGLRGRAGGSGEHLIFPMICQMTQGRVYEPLNSILEP
jgi:hypothetical protein